MKKIWAINQSVLAILLTEAFALIFDSVQKQHEFLLEDHLTVAWRDGCSP